MRVGTVGFVTGMSVGRALIEEQTSLLGSVLASMNGLLGSPYAELLWCQAVGALLVGMITEVVYCSVLVGGARAAHGRRTRARVRMGASRLPGLWRKGGGLWRWRTPAARAAGMRVRGTRGEP